MNKYLSVIVYSMILYVTIVFTLGLWDQVDDFIWFKLNKSISNSYFVTVDWLKWIKEYVDEFISSLSFSNKWNPKDSIIEK